MPPMTTPNDPLLGPGVYLAPVRYLGGMRRVFRIDEEWFVAEERLVLEAEVEATMAELEEKYHVQHEWRKRGFKPASVYLASSAPSAPLASRTSADRRESVMGVLENQALASMEGKQRAKAG